MLKSILQFFGIKEKEIEIEVLTSLSTFAGGVKSNDDIYWTCGQNFVAYADCETNQLYNIKGSINWKTKDNSKHPFDFEPQTIYRVKVKQTRKNDFAIFSLIEITDSDVKNEQLELLVDDFFITDGVFNFEFKKKDTSAVGEVNWLGEEIFVDFYDVEDINSAKQAFAHFKKIMKDVNAWDANLRTYIAEQTLEKVNDWIIQNVEHAIITKEMLKDEQVIDTVIVYPNGDFHISYILKTYHYMINVEGNVNGELKKAYLE